MKLLLLAFLLLVSPHAAHGGALAGGLSQDHILLRAGFRGAELLVFGALDEEPLFSSESAIVITLTGPMREVGIWQKAPIAGIWANYEWREFPSIPIFYALAATRPLERIVSEESRRELHIGAESFLPPRPSAFGRALLRLMRQKGAFPNKVEQVVFSGQRLFQAHFMIPPSAPVGIYRAKIHLFENGTLRDTQTLSLQVDKTGLPALLADFAWRYPFFYGLVAIVIGLVIGGAAFLIMRRP